jgi:hypothetical protein
MYFDLCLLVDGHSLNDIARGNRMYFKDVETKIIYNIIIYFLITSMIIGCASEDNTGPYIYWSDQLAFAQKSINKIADDAVLVNMSARSIYEPIEYDQHHALKLSFLFIRPSGDQFNVSFNSMQPDKTVTTEDRGQLDFPLSLREQEDLRSALNSVHIGPSDALSSTLSIGRDFKNKYGVIGLPVTYLTLDPPEPDRFRIPALWRVTYFAPVQRVTLHVWVHPQTGEVLAQDLLP